MIAPSPAKILRDALKSVPELKWALGIAGIIAIIAIVEVGWKINLSIAVAGTIVMLLLMAVLVIFARLSTAAPEEFKQAIQVFMWGALCLTLATAALLFTSGFFSWPLNFHLPSTDRAILGGYVPTEEDQKVWALEDQVNIVRGAWETISYFGPGKLSEEVLEHSTKLSQALLDIDDSKLGPSGHVIKREYVCYAMIMAATTEPDISRRSKFADQAIDMCNGALSDLSYIESNKNRNANFKYVADWEKLEDQRTFTTYLLAIASCVKGITVDDQEAKTKATKFLDLVPSYYLDRYPPSRDWVLKQCSSSDKEARK